MRLINSKKPRRCKKCPTLITSGDLYSRQRRDKSLCYNCYHDIKRGLIVKLKDLNAGDNFILVRNGKKYINAEYQKIVGIGMKHNYVIPLNDEGMQMPVRTLHLQCKVKLIRDEDGKV